MDALDRAIINRLQVGFPLISRPFTTVAEELGTTEEELIRRLESLLERKLLNRFGPLYHAERLGGALTLAAMAVAVEDFERVAAQVNAFPQVAHNYARDHTLNLWFVLATETPEEIATVIKTIEIATGYPIYNLPKLEEFFIGLHLTV